MYLQVKMQEYSELGTEVGEIKNYVMMNLFGLVTEDLNNEMYNRSVPIFPSARKIGKLCSC